MDIPPFLLDMPDCMRCAVRMTGKSHTDPEGKTVCPRGHAASE